MSGFWVSVFVCQDVCVGGCLYVSAFNVNVLMCECALCERFCVSVFCVSAFVCECVCVCVPG